MATKITTRVLADDAVTDAKIADVTLTTATQSASDNTTKIATTAYVTTAIANLADSAPSTLNTLNELAAALGDDANYATTTTNAIAAKLPLAGGTLTGDLTIPNKIIHAGDTDTYLSFANANDFRIVVGNSTRAAFNTSKIHFNQEGISQDFQVEGANVDNLLYVDASADKVGIKITNPLAPLHIQGSSASTYTGAGPTDTLRVSQSTHGNFISSEVDGIFSYFGVDSNRAKFAGYDYANNSNIDVMIGQNTFYVKPQHIEVTGNTALTAGFNSTHSNGPYIRFQESGADKFYIGASSAVSGGTYTGYDLYAPAGKTVQVFSEGRAGGTASLQVKSDHIVLIQDINSGSTTGDTVVVATTNEGAVHLQTETGNARAAAITFRAGSYLTQSAITSVHNSSEGTNISIHTTDSYANGPKERFRVDHHGHSRGVSYRGTRTAQPAFILGGGDVVKQNLVLYYNFADSRCYGGSGTTVTDLSGNNQTGYMGANVAWQSAGMMDFQGGANNNGAFIGTPLALPSTDSVTLMFWIYYDDQPASPGDYQLMGWQANGGYGYFGVQSNGGSYGYIGRSSSIAEANHIVSGQQWHHLCVTRDRGDGSNGRSYTYIDGIMTGFRKSEDPYAHSQTMTVGALGGASNGSGTAGHTLDGKIASVAVYDRALTPPEIYHNMMVDIHRLIGT